jgi:hypothetical protein
MRSGPLTLISQKNDAIVLQLLRPYGITLLKSCRAYSNVRDNRRPVYTFGLSIIQNQCVQARKRPVQVELVRQSTAKLW